MSDGHGGVCPGGGGGGGGQASTSLGLFSDSVSDGGDGNYGGGGGGGSDDDNSSGSGSGGNGGFGGGGGASGTVRSLLSGSHGGNGGFGGGSGFGIGTDIDEHGEPGNKAPFGGSGNGSCCGGGGGALGAAIFNEGGSVFIRNSTFTNNDADRGEGGVNDAGTDRANRGADAGAAIFSLNGSLVIENTTISGNFVTGSDNQAGGGVVVMAFPLVRNFPAKASLMLTNTILSRNGSNDCLLLSTPDPSGGNNVGTIDASGSGNLILNNNGCPGVAVSADPQLAPLALDPRSTIGTPTLALPAGSPAIDAADDSRFLARDQRGVPRPQGPRSDIGAYEFVPRSADLSLTSQTSAAQIVAGESFTYTVQLTNSGPSDAADVVFSDPAPAGVTFNSCSSTAGACILSGAGASLNLATLPNGETVTITIQATLNAAVADGTSLANIPSVTSNTFDPNTTNNSGSAGSTTITVQNKSDLLVGTASSVDVYQLWRDSELHRDGNEPGSVRGLGRHFDRSSARTGHLSVDELRRGLLYDSGTGKGRNGNLQFWKHAQRSVSDSELHGASFDTAGSGVDHEHRGCQFAQLRSEPGQQFRECKNVSFRQQTSIETHHSHGPILPVDGWGRCAWLAFLTYRGLPAR